MKNPLFFIVLVLFSCEKETATTSESGQHGTQTSFYTGQWAGYDACLPGTCYITANMWDSAGTAWYFSHGNELYPDTYPINITNDLCSIPNFFHVTPTGSKWIRGWGNFSNDTLFMYYQIEYYNTPNDHIVYGNMILVKQ